MKISNMTSPNGNKVKNQFIVTDGNVEYFQSYDSVIAKKENGKVTLDERFWDYSVTTGKYRNEFLGEKKAETQAKIDSGEYQLADLNSK